MALKYLIDTNIFLEILLDQDKRADCEMFLNKNIQSSCFSDFSLHSIGVILFRTGQEKTFQLFLDDVLTKMTIISLSPASLSQLSGYREKYNFDFDDAYQYALAKEHGLTIITQDHDFKAVDPAKALFV